VKPFAWKYHVLQRTQERPQSAFPTKPNTLFFNAEQYGALRELLLQHISQEEILHQAEEARAHRFAFFTNNLCELGEAIHWHKDYASGKEWDAAKPASELDFLTSTNGSDVKYAWEVNRCHWFTWLGMSYLLDGDEKWVRAFKRDVESWQAANPLGMGIHWAMPMEGAIRATNWILAASFFHKAVELDATFWQGFTRTLWQHGRFLEYNLEYVRHNANHFMSNAMGLVVLGAYFHDTQDSAKDGKRWFLKGKAFMEKEILRQFYPDGINYEKSTSYHRFVIEMCMIAFATAEYIHSPFQAQYFERLNKAYLYLQSYSRPDGSAPRLGDTDNGRVLRYFAVEDFNNHLKNIALEQIFFASSLQSNTLQLNTLQLNTKNSATLRLGSTDILLRESLNTAPDLADWNHNMPERGHLAAIQTRYFSTHFPYGNYVIWRNKQTHLIVDTGDYGMNGWGGHGHNDCLSFELWLGGESIFIDSGTGAYTSNIALRNALRSTRAHNTVMVCNAEQTEYAGLWRIKRDELAPVVRHYDASPQGMRLCAEHSGYASRFGVKHKRTFLLEMKADENECTGSLTIEDTLLPTQSVNTSVDGTVQFILPPEVRIVHVSPTLLHCQVGKVRLEMRCDAGFTVEACQISLFYGDVRWGGQRITIPCGTTKTTETRIQWSLPA
jgi:uncharacterized heparinase superfamily protein